MSQLDPLPRDLPFRIISKTIGRGAYASIKKAIPISAPSPVFVVKFIHKEYAIKHGGISTKQLGLEVSLHQYVGKHLNVIEFLAAGDNSVWQWIAMEYAEGGDLFDKIEADVGVTEDIAHLYFKQLVNGVSFLHSKGVSHRDIKPENLLLSESGDLKIADFGLSSLFKLGDKKRTCTTMCGSPPYLAPEVVASLRSIRRQDPNARGYEADLVDIWSCGVVLFVLLVGNTPWDEPTAASWEFDEYCKTSGRSSDELWCRLPPSVMSLLRGMMNVDPRKRFSFEFVRQHPWYTRSNSLLTSNDRMSDPIQLATQMLENLRIDFSQQPVASQKQPLSQDAMDVDGLTLGYCSTQPEAPISDVTFDWERPPRIGAYSRISSSQPVHTRDRGLATMANGRGGAGPALAAALADEPTMSQFTSTAGLPLSLTQHARRFRDIIPNYSLTRFFSHLNATDLVQMLREAFHTLNIPVPPGSITKDVEGVAWLKVKTLDGRRCPMSGDIVVDRYSVGSEELLEVRFVKVTGDPLEWRRFFKKVVILCKEGVYIPE